MIGSASYAGIGIMIAGGFILPVVICIWWLLKKKEKFTTVLIGAATWFVFAVLLEAIPKYLLFNPSISLGKTIVGNAALYTVIGALMAGIFEETGRLVAFKTLLRKRTNKETGISHGIGHGGFEAMFLLAITGIQYITYASMINSGAFQTVVDIASAAGADVSSLEALPSQIMAFTPMNGVLSVVERAFAILLHIGLSIMVFNAVRRSKIGYYLLAILLHALYDVPAALYQTGVLNIYIVEVMIAVYSVLFFVIVIRTLYKRGDSISASPAPDCQK